MYCISRIRGFADAALHKLIILAYVAYLPSYLLIRTIKQNYVKSTYLRVSLRIRCTVCESKK